MVIPVDLNETPFPGEAPEETVLRLARAKAARGRELAIRAALQARVLSAAPCPAEEGSSPVPSISAGAPPPPRDGSAMEAGPPRLVVGADTAVVLEKEMLGKPAGNQAAVRMLSLLSDRVHRVLTALVVDDLDGGLSEGGVAETRVRFARLSREEIERYVATGEPLDKAGAYGIQGDGHRLVDRIEGSYTNVVGFPVELFAEILTRLGLTLADLARTP